MAEYIKKADVLEYLSARRNQVLKSPLSTLDAKFEVMEIFDFVDHRVESADVAQVRHGQWIMKHKHRGGFRRYTGIDDMGEQHTITVDERVEYDDRYCSECGKQSADNFLNYCPNCGAKIDLEG